MLPRHRELSTIHSLLQRYPVVALIGARQVGKTTLARMLADDYSRNVEYFDLENPEHLARLAEPMLVLKALHGLVVIDEVQRLPGLFGVLRVLADRRPLPCRFLVLGSASPELLRQSSDSLAGRIAYHRLNGLGLDEVGDGEYRVLWERGGLPLSYLAHSDGESFEWRRTFVHTFLERDLPQLGISVSSTTMRRFWTMLAHWHGQVWNGSEFARSFGVSDTTVRGYLDRLTSALVVHQLQPWHENISKRQVKSPKVYVADSGMLHALLNVRTTEDLEMHPKVGASWEGFAVQQVVRIVEANEDECFFWATHAGAELDLVVIRGSKRFGYEMKRSATPKPTRGMHSALCDLRLERIDVIHAGDHTFALGERIRAVALSRLLKDVEPL